MVDVPIYLTSLRKAHLSSCGKHLAILTLSFRVILVQDFWRLLPVSPSSSPTSVPSPQLLKDISKQIDFYIDPPFAQRDGRLAYDRGRVAVASTYGIYVLTLDSILDQLGEIALPPKDDSLETPLNSAERDPPWPDLRVREVSFGNIFSTETVPCLQLTETRLYLSVFPRYFRDKRGENMWCYDFASPPSGSGIVRVVEMEITERVLTPVAHFGFLQ
jgi:hypothetical protein